MNPSTPQSLATVKPFSKRSSNLIRRLQVSSITFAFFSFSVIVCCRHPFWLHPRPVANFLCSVFSSFSFFGSISQSHESNGGGEERRGEAGAEVRLLQTLTAATFVQLSVSGEGGMWAGTGICARKGMCVRVCGLCVARP